MAVSDAFLVTCQTSIEASVEYATYNTAHAAYVAGSRSTRPALWHAAYTGVTSPAYQLKRTIRGVVTAHNGGSDGSFSPLDIEAAVRTLTARYVANPKRPPSATQEAAELQKAINEDRLS